MATIYEQIEQVTLELLKNDEYKYSRDRVEVADFVKIFETGRLKHKLASFMILSRADLSSADLRDAVKLELDRYIKTIIQEHSYSQEKDISTLPLVGSTHFYALPETSTKSYVMPEDDSEERLLKAFLLAPFLDADAVLTREAEQLLKLCNSSEKVIVKKIFDDLSSLLRDEDCRVAVKLQTFKNKIQPQILTDALKGVRASLIEKIVSFFVTVGRTIANKITFGLVAQKIALVEHCSSSVNRILCHLRASHPIQVLEKEMSQKRSTDYSFSSPSAP